MGEKLSSQYKGFIFDVDGVVYREHRSVPDAVPAIRRLIEADKAVAFASNSSMQSAASLVERLRGLGLSVNEHHVVVGTWLTARVVSKKWPRCTAYVLGGENLVAELTAAGIRVVNHPERHGHKCDCLIVGNDLDLSYDRLKTALRVLLAGAKFVAVNVDALSPGADGYSPAPGGLVAALAAMAKREPDIIVGKPFAPLLLEALERVGTPLHETVLIGDTLETDIQGGNDIGLPTALVLTGNTNRQEAEASSVQPKHILNTLAEI